MLITKRQNEILALVKQHKKSSEIAKTLGISSRTVDMHIQLAMDTLGVHTRHQAAALVSKNSKVLFNGQVEEGLDSDKLAKFAENFPSAIAMFDTKMNYIAYTGNYKSLFKFEDENLVGHSYQDLFPGKIRLWEKLIKKCMTGKVLKNESDKVKCKNGKCTLIKWELHPWLDTLSKEQGTYMFCEALDTN